MKQLALGVLILSDLASPVHSYMVKLCGNMHLYNLQLAVPFCFHFDEM